MLTHRKYAPAVGILLQRFATFRAGLHLQFWCKRRHDWMFIRCAAVGVSRETHAASVTGNWPKTTIQVLQEIIKKRLLDAMF